MIALPDRQIEQIRTAATPIPPRLRAAYLQRVAEQLSGRSFDDGDVFRAASTAQTEIMRTLGAPPELD